MCKKNDSQTEFVLAPPIDPDGHGMTSKIEVEHPAGWIANRVCEVMAERKMDVKGLIDVNYRGRNKREQEVRISLRDESRQLLWGHTDDSVGYLTWMFNGSPVWRDSKPEDSLIIDSLVEVIETTQKVTL